jgi:hypothetical protein
MAFSDATKYFLEESIDVQLRKMQQEALGSLLEKDYVTARNRANAALLIMSTIPDGEISGISSQTWNRVGIVTFIEQLDKLEASADTAETGGMVIQNYQYSGRRSC